MATEKIFQRKQSEIIRLTRELEEAISELKNLQRQLNK